MRGNRVKYSKAAMLAVAILAGAAIAEGPATRPMVTKAGIIISKETTYVDGPVLEDGTIDYVAAHNAIAAVEARKGPKFFVPLVPKAGAHDVLGSQYMPINISMCGRALQTRASFRLEVGDFKDAREDAAAALRLSRLLRLSHLDFGTWIG